MWTAAWQRSCQEFLQDTCKCLCRYKQRKVLEVAIGYRCLQESNPPKSQHLLQTSASTKLIGWSTFLSEWGFKTGKKREKEQKSLRKYRRNNHANSPNVQKHVPALSFAHHLPLAIRLQVVNGPHSYIRFVSHLPINTHTRPSNLVRLCPNHREQLGFSLALSSASV